MLKLKYLTIFILIISVILIPESVKINPIHTQVAKNTFNIYEWEIKNLSNLIINELKQSKNHKSDETDDLEKLIESEIKKNKILIFNKFLFPKVRFKIDNTPNILIISPKNKIKLTYSILLKQNLTIKEKEAIENQIEAKFNVSAIILNIGGIAFYPSLIPKDINNNKIIKNIIHEWLHQYFALYNLGQNIYKNNKMLALNETIVSYISEELASNIISKTQSTNIKSKKINSFNSEIRFTRSITDNLLSKNKIDMAEKFMLSQTNKLNYQGYQIRKINQAYFAFYNSYGTTPQSTNNILPKLKCIRTKNLKLHEFTNKVKNVDNFAEFENILNSDPDYKKCLN